LKKHLIYVISLSLFNKRIYEYNVNIIIVNVQKKSELLLYIKSFTKIEEERKKTTKDLIQFI